MTRSNARYDNKRIVYLDALRGIFLIIMTLDHLGGPIKSITFQPFGFVCAAVGFIYLSGFVFGLVYTRKYLETDFNTIKIKSERRALVIYYYHLLIFILVAIPSFLGIINSTELESYFERPFLSFVMFALLLFQPSNMDILPMYIIFILMGPFVLRGLVQGRWKFIFAISGFLWVISQFPIFQYNGYDDSSRWINFGYFNILSWQFLFYAGVFFGFAKETGRYRLPVNKRVMSLLIVFSCLFFIIRHMPESSKLNSVFSLFSDRSTLGILRLLNFAILAYIVYALSHSLGTTMWSGFLAMIGSHSIQVFAYSVCLVYYVHAIDLLPDQLETWKIIIIDLLLAGTIVLPAFLHKYALVRFPSLKKAGL